MSYSSAAANDTTVSDDTTCHRLMSSPTVEGTNRLLWSTSGGGVVDGGIVVRTLDLYDKPTKMQQHLDKDPHHFPGFNTSLLPASYVHASMRTSNPIFWVVNSHTTTPTVVAGILAGSKYKFNHKENVSSSNHNTAADTAALVDTPVCYPLDAGSNKRYDMLHNMGGSCHPQGEATKRNGMCIINNNTNLTTTTTTKRCLFETKYNCQCNTSQVLTEDMGTFFAQWLSSAYGPKQKVAPYTCWLDLTTSTHNNNDNNNNVSDSSDDDNNNDHHHTLQHVIIASNSYWMTRKLWRSNPVHKKNGDVGYWGWTECPTTTNIRSHDMIDALVVQLPAREVVQQQQQLRLTSMDTDQVVVASPPPRTRRQQQRKHKLSLCDYGPNVRTNVGKQLQQMYDYGFGHFPVVFLEQLRGMTNVTECQLMWNGTQCYNGYRKELFTQEYNFTDGSCLVVPKGCRDVYYFPATDNATKKCNVSSTACREFERYSAHHQRYNHHRHHEHDDGRSSSFNDNVAFSKYELQNMFDDSAAETSLSLLPSSSLPMIINLCAVFGIYYCVLRRRRGMRFFSYPSSKSLFLPKTCLISLTLVLLPFFLVHLGIGYSIMVNNVVSTTTDTALNDTTQVTVGDDSSITSNRIVFPISAQLDEARNETTTLTTLGGKQQKEEQDGHLAKSPDVAQPKRHDGLVPRSDVNDASHSIAETAPGAACPTVLPHDTRILLLTVVQAFHGSTALASVLMSSPNIATYCSGRTWQCEGFVKARKLACRSQPMCFRDPRQLGRSPRQQEQQQQQQRQQARRHRDVNLLDLFSHDWNLSRPILHDKLFPREPGYTELWQSSLQRREPSPQMKQRGIRHVLPVYVIMWTPSCVLNVQTKSRNELTSSNRNTTISFLQREVWNLQHMRQLHESLVSTGTPALVVSYADLIFAPHRTLQRLHDFMPCVGGSSPNLTSLTTTYIPQWNVDIFTENKWKVRGTVHDFASKLNATECCGYNVTTGRCMDTTNLRRVPELTSDLMELESYFDKHSRT